MIENAQRACLITVIMPTFNQASFISRAISSLINQTFEAWELIIINDGSTDQTQDVIGRFLEDPRVSCISNTQNSGMGRCLNIGLRHAKTQLIAYLPSDDIYFKDHLMLLYKALHTGATFRFAYSGMRKRNSEVIMTDVSEAVFMPGNYFQLVQVLHVKTIHQWVERSELVTDDLNKMFWWQIYAPENSVCTGSITCEWVIHAAQTHKLIMETLGGSIYAYKKHFDVRTPIRFRSSTGNYIDEEYLYRDFRSLPPVNAKPGLKILLVGELAYNPERIVALESAGHQLFGLWINSPESYNAVGPLPFGNITDIPLNNWRNTVLEIKPDIIYALLNTQAVPLAHHVLEAGLDIPFVWHFKEGPFFAMQADVWDELVYLYRYADGLIFINEESKNWVCEFQELTQPVLILDGDLPPGKWFTDEKSGALSDIDGEVHTVVPGRPMGINYPELQLLKAQKIHLHFYGEYYHATWKDWVEMALKVAPGYIHLHAHCYPENWVKELSQYDAGWLHTFTSDNYGELSRASWNDLNYPARMNTLAAAGLPMIQKCNSQHLVATQSLTHKLNTGIFYEDFQGLSYTLHHHDQLSALKGNTWAHRAQFSFDEHVEKLTAFFYQVITLHHKK